MFEKFDASRSVFKKPQFLPFSGPTSSNPLRLFVFASMQGTDEGHFNNLTLPSSSSGSGGGDSEGGHRGQDGGGGGEAKGSGGDPIWTFGNPFHWKHCSAPGCKEGNTVLTRLAPSSETQIQVIEWNMMDMKKFYPLSMLSKSTTNLSTLRFKLTLGALETLLFNQFIIKVRFLSVACSTPLPLSKRRFRYAKKNYHSLSPFHFI